MESGRGEGGCGFNVPQAQPGAQAQALPPWLRQVANYRQPTRVLEVMTTPIASTSLRRPALCAAILLVTACGSASLVDPVVAAPGEVFELRVGQRAMITGEDLTITFEAVTSDSRCPTDVECVWAGDAVVRLRLETGAADVARDVHTTLDPRFAELDEYRIELVALEPAPTSERALEQAEYRARLRVAP